MRNLAILIVVCALFSSCADNKNMLTQVYPDGSCSREFRATPDSAFMVGDTSHNPFPVKLDPSWKITYSRPDSNWKICTHWPLKSWNYKKDTSKKVEVFPWVSARKKYSTVKAMQDSFCFDHSDWKNVHPRIVSEKNFRWFFTNYSYKEIYPKYNTLNHVPIEKYLSKEDIELYFTENPKFKTGLIGKEIKEKLDNIDGNVNDWLNKNFFEETFIQLTKFIKKEDPSNPYLKKIFLVKDSLFEIVRKKDKPFEGDLIDAIEKQLKIKNLFTNENLKKKIKADKSFEQFLMPFGSHYYYELLIPGKIIETNSTQKHGDTLSWNVDAYRFFFTDYTIKAESRVANIWAFIVSGLFILGVALSFFIKRKG